MLMNAIHFCIGAVYSGILIASAHLMARLF
jgi:hypothetical protein